MRYVCFLMALVLLLSLSVSAEVPGAITYQGRLTDSGGDPVTNGPYLIKFTIYAGESGNDSLWSSGFQSVTVTDGCFSYQLGASVPFPSGLFSADTVRYLGITIDVDPEITPRTRLVSVAYACQARNADTAIMAMTVVDDAITADKIASGAVTSNKIQSNAVHSYHIADGEIQFADIGQNGAADGQVMKWDNIQAEWYAADDETGAGGDITGVIAGSGLTGGGTAGEVTLAIANLGVTTDKIANDAITSTKIQYSAVDDQALALDAVTSAHILDGEIGDLDIADNAVHAYHLNANAVTSPKIQDGTILFGDIGQNGAADGEVMKWNAAATQWEASADANSGGDITGVTAGTGLAGGGVSGAVQLYIPPDGITNSLLDDNAVESGNIVNGTITDADISAGADISPSKIYNTAMTINGYESIYGTKNFYNFDYFWGNTYFHDSTMRVNGDGIMMGSSVVTPSTAYLVQMVRGYNTASTRSGLFSDLTNSGTGPLLGVVGRASHTTTGSGGYAYGISGYAKSDGLYRYGGYCQAEALTTSSTYGYTYGIRALASYGNYAYGIYAYANGANTNYAGYFSGSVTVTGTLSKGAGSFKIDHPLDPENKYLCHSFVESPDMMNVYNGNVVLDANGYAEVQLPDYFDALNKDFRYQLTPIGAPGPDLYIAEEISDNRFAIAGGVPGMKVSWMVTGIRHDKYAEANRIPVEMDKPPEEKGQYIHPEAFGLSEDRFIHFEQYQAEKLANEEMKR
ncbi:MAG: hypothetical protein JW763_04950 [candidate division Zixibacteria bacterium]|nr:hypothetical protein [candidate division Zixibacteria bacterium]